LRPGLTTVITPSERLVVGTGKFDHLTPVLRDVLRWLHVLQRIQFKVALTAFDFVRGFGPKYFRAVCIEVADISSRLNFRSVQRVDLVVPRTRTQLGRRSFHVAAPVVSNALPVYHRSTYISRGQFGTGTLQQSLRLLLRTFYFKSVLYLLTYLLTYCGAGAELVRKLNERERGLKNMVERERKVAGAERSGERGLLKEV